MSDSLENRAEIKPLTASTWLKGLHPPFDSADAHPDRTPPPADVVGDEFDGNPVIGLAVQQIRAFGADIDRETAKRLLRFWRHTGELSSRERAGVLFRFPSPGDQRDDCRNCGDPIRRVAPTLRWFHPGAKPNEAHIQCGRTGAQLTVAEPIKTWAR